MGWNQSWPCLRWRQKLEVSFRCGFLGCFRLDKSEGEISASASTYWPSFFVWLAQWIIPQELRQLWEQLKFNLISSFQVVGTIKDKNPSALTFPASCCLNQRKTTWRRSVEPLSYHACVEPSTAVWLWWHDRVSTFHLHCLYTTPCRGKRASVKETQGYERA